MSTTSGVSMTGRPSPPRSAPSLVISRGRAYSQMRYGKTLLERFPELSAVFLAGVVDFRVIAAAIFRTDLLTDTDALATIDAQLTATAPSWNTLSRDPPAVLPNSSPVQDVSRRACRMDPDTAARRHHHLDLTTRRTYTTTPTGALFFPNSGSPPRSSLPTVPASRIALAIHRKRTRTQDRAHRIECERARNRARYAADPPPFSTPRHFAGCSAVMEI